jgi:hypothetical protein
MPDRSGPADDTHHLAVCCVGSRPHRSLAEGTRGLLAPAGRHQQILQVDRGPTLDQHQVRAGGGALHRHHPSIRGPKLHHHRQWHVVHRKKVPGLLRRPPHPCGLGRRSSPHDEWAGGACQRYDFAGTQTEDLQRPQQVQQAVDERATLGGRDGSGSGKVRVSHLPARQHIRASSAYPCPRELAGKIFDPYPYPQDIHGYQATRYPPENTIRVCGLVHFTKNINNLTDII